MTLIPHRLARQLGLLLACAAAVAMLQPLWYGKLPTWPWGALSLLLLMLVWAAPQVLTPLVKAWLLLGRVMGYVNTRIILALVFFVFITPLALFFRIIGRDQLALKRTRAASYWLAQEREYSRDSFRNQF